MSVVGDAITAVLAEVTTAIPTVTTLEGAIPVDKIPTNDFPHAQAFEPVMAVTEVLQWRIEKRAWSFFVVISHRDQTDEQMNDLFEDFTTQLATNPRLGTPPTVHWTNVSSYQLIENVDGRAKTKSLVFEVVVEVFSP